MAFIGSLNLPPVLALLSRQNCIPLPCINPFTMLIFIPHLKETNEHKELYKKQIIFNKNNYVCSRVSQQGFSLHPSSSSSGRG